MQERQFFKNEIKKKKTMKSGENLEDNRRISTQFFVRKLEGVGVLSHSCQHNLVVALQLHASPFQAAALGRHAL